MSVYIGKKCSRGVPGSKNPIISRVLNIDATSGSMNKINGESAKQFSPMYLKTKSNIIFENYWQYSKVFEELNHIDSKGEVTQKWYDFREKGFKREKGDRHPKGTKSNEILYIDQSGKRHFKYYKPVFAIYDDVIYDYVSSRKNVYAPIYAELVLKTKAFKELKYIVDSGQSVQILDFDTYPGSFKVTVDLLRDRINDPSVPFGHGYILAGLLTNISPKDYCM